MRVVNAHFSVALFPCEGQQLADACRDFEALAPLHFRGVESLHRLTLEGYFNCEQVTFNGIPAFVMWWTKTVEGSLCIHGLQTLQADIPIDVAFIAADVMQKREGCNSVVISATRQGMIRKALACGFKVHSLTMRKA